MQISRKFLVACAAACATTLAARGADTPAQIKAREAMRQKLQDSRGQPSPAAPTTGSNSDSGSVSKARDALHNKLQETPAPAATAPEPPAAAAPTPVAPAPAAAASAPVAPAVSADAPVPPQAAPVQRADPDAIAKARDAVRQKIEESPAAPPPLTAAPVPAPAPATPPATAAPEPPPVAAAPAPQPVVVVPAPAPTAQTAAPGDSDTIAKAREALRLKINEASDVGPKADNESIAKAREAVRQRMQSITYAQPASQGGNGPSVNFPPLEGPALPISSEKQQRLSELLLRYRADQVTPEQYQEERAKILAGR